MQNRPVTLTKEEQKKILEQQLDSMDLEVQHIQAEKEQIAKKLNELNAKN
jgi:hypothetical protein